MIQDPAGDDKKTDLQLAQVIRALAAEDPQQLLAIRRAFLAVIKAPTVAEFKAGLIQLATELENHIEMD